MKAASRVYGVHEPRSLGISRYVERLAAACQEQGMQYLPASAPTADALSHFHLGNSSRRVVWQAARERRPYLLTMHDVLPRTRALTPLYRSGVHPFAVARAACLLCHSRFAADLLAREAAIALARIEVVPHPASPAPTLTRSQALATLGLEEGPPLFVLPGILKRAKLIAEVVEAARPLLAAERLRLMLAGKVADERTAQEAQKAGAAVLRFPDDAAYRACLAASDCILVLRSRSVGETNGPLLDALGAGRAVLATPTGSIPEVGGEAVLYCQGTERAIRTGLELLADGRVRSELEQAAARRALELTWEASAAHHAGLFREVFDG
jgi:glycosyltransferase involved in cell wall biosynthesis